MEDIKKINENITTNEDHFDWGECIHELQEGDIDLVLRPTVRVPQERYEELIKAEATLEILGKVIVKTHPYEISTYRAVAGKYIPDEKDCDDE